ncbi:FtsK/SpoIIIE domain-containing protein [Roseburia sp. 1XD42-69]|uniref:FtsK/SpoIIIE domain-containing protein n=1 Tax=Roseburia sp. 1XD42-69 TaxID=2320088 RepID=UPI000EA387E9|nr:FtsK/SpoIIIE domain-containing protein [Roseburia sp. 1XD42-69]RKJ62279.1 hypothetical protein D7Y06_17860 [Roseburia sp. 1XD42-69]
MEEETVNWGYLTPSLQYHPKQIRLDIKSHCHALITGSSGSGKSYALLYILGSLLKSSPKTCVYFLDFKNSTDFAFLEGHPHYYSGDNCYQGILDYYAKFCDARTKGRNEKRHLLIFDEYPAFVNYLTGKDRQDKTKNCNNVLNAVSEILMLGRGINFGVWVVTQRADSSLFGNGARDNFMVILGLGRMSREQKGMVFTGEDIPDKIYRRGEGILLADGHPLQEVTFPRIQNIVNWKKHIKGLLSYKDS